MRFRAPILTLREPLKPKPLGGLALGVVTGLLLSALSGGKAFGTSWPDQAAGFAVAGATIGVIIGACLPLFRRRWVAGVIVGAATAVGLALAAPFWGAEVFRDLAVFFGVVYGIIYARLFWQYEAAKTS